jgi:hypothetical protein
VIGDAAGVDMFVAVLVLTESARRRNWALVETVVPKLACPLGCPKGQVMFRCARPGVSAS